MLFLLREEAFLFITHLVQTAEYNLTVTANPPDGVFAEYKPALPAYSKKNNFLLFSFTKLKCCSFNGVWSRFATHEHVGGSNCISSCF